MKKFIKVISFLGVLFLIFFLASDKKINGINSKEQEEVLARLSDEAIEVDTIWKDEPQGTLDYFVDEISDTYKGLKHLKLIGKKVPGFSYEDRNNIKVSITDFLGKWVLIDVWASWCKPCIGDIASMHKLESHLKEENIVFLGVSIDSEGLRDKWISVLDKKNPSGIQIFTGNENMEFQDMFSISTIPKYFLINPEGIIIDMDLPRPYTSKMEEIIRSYINNYNKTN